MCEDPGLHDDRLATRGVNETVFPARCQGEDHRHARVLVRFPARTGYVAARYVSLKTLEIAERGCRKRVKDDVCALQIDMTAPCLSRLRAIGQMGSEGLLVCAHMFQRSAEVMHERPGSRN